MGDRNSYSVSSKNVIATTQSRGQRINATSIASQDLHNLLVNKNDSNFAEKSADLMKSGKLQRLYSCSIFANVRHKKSMIKPDLIKMNCEINQEDEAKATKHPIRAVKMLLIKEYTMIYY